jgi:TQXA domain-containing protein
VPVVFVCALAVLLLDVASAGAVFRGNAPTGTRVRANTQMVMTGTGPGQGVTGFIANANTVFDPATDPYPSGTPLNPPPGFTRKDEGFAGIIHGRPTDGSPDLSLYCIDIATDTYNGIGYILGTWDRANVPNVGLVARILSEYYPNNASLPAGLQSDSQRAAAVQAAIWFFSDRYALSANDPLYATVVGIVNHVRSQGPIPEPKPPSLTLTPSQISAPRRVVGPITLTTDAPPATVTATGATMYSNRAGTMELGNGTTATDVPSGQPIWLRSAGTSTASLQATAVATVPSGNVYLYDGNSGVGDAQKLILAQTATLRSIVNASAEFLPYGSLVVSKTIAGDGAGSEGQVVIHVACDDGIARPDFVIPAGTPAGTTSRTYRHIAAGTTCTVTETSNGAVTGVNVVVTGDGQEVTIPAGGRESVAITDTYIHVFGPSSLLVSKTISGPLAGSQGPVTIQVVCNGTLLSPVFTIGANTAAGTTSQTYDDIAPDSVCTVTETADGATDTVTATVSGNDQTVTVPPGEVVPVNVMDVYQRTPDTAPDVPTAPTGALRVTKTIAGPVGGQQGPIAILVACGSPTHVYAFLIPAHAHAGPVSRVFPDLPVGSRCTVTEVTNGHTGGVAVVGGRKRKQVTIPTDATVTVNLTDTFVSTSPAAVTG